MIQLAEVESRLVLFAQGIAGRYYHIKPTSEVTSRRLVVDPADAALTSDTLLLPEALNVSESAFYRVLVLQQLGLAEFGTLAFTIAQARRVIPALTAYRAVKPEGRMSDLELFYHHVAHPGLLGRLFAACERARINAHIRHHYPGIKRHQDAYHEYVLERMPATDTDSVNGMMECLTAHVLGSRSPALRSHPAGLALISALAGAARVGADVYAAAAASLECYRLYLPYVAQPDTGMETVDADGPTDPIHWLQRDVRLKDWRQDLKQLDDIILAAESVETDGTTIAESRALGDGEIRPQSLDLRTLQNERDLMARRIETERSAIRDATGQARPEARSYRYDEWDHRNQRYLRSWCRLFEERLTPADGKDLHSLKQVMVEHRPRVQQQLENIKPLGFQRVFRVADGDELDFNAVVQARQDIRSGSTPDERVYSRRERIQRDVCAAFLVDLSASTDDVLEKPEPISTTLDDDEFPNLRDPYDAAVESHAGQASPEPRRIIDVQRESMLVMSAALEHLGDSYGIYGFSGYGRDCVEFFVAKEPEQPFTQDTLAAIAGMKPKRSTRMGTAIRHAVGKLVRSGNALKVLLILSDGFPQDVDYGPERGQHEYGVQDTAKALAEARDKGIETFCVTVDRSGHDYLKRMCPDSRYMVIEEIEDLPAALTKVYETLTGS